MNFAHLLNLLRLHFRDKRSVALTPIDLSVMLAGVDRLQKERSRSELERDYYQAVLEEAHERDQQRLRNAINRARADAMSAPVIPLRSAQ